MSKYHWFVDGGLSMAAMLLLSAMWWGNLTLNGVLIVGKIRLVMTLFLMTYLIFTVWELCK